MKKIFDVLLTGGLIVMLLFVAFGPDGVFRTSADRWVAVHRARTLIHANWASMVATGIRVEPGQTGGPVLMEFSDYECPFCRKAHEVVRQLARQHPEVAVVLEPLPLPIHEHAKPAALAEVCASEQGKADLMHQFLFQSTDWLHLGGTQWKALAARIGVADTTRFHRCMSGPGAEDRLRRTTDLARRLMNIHATPTFVSLNGVLSGVPSVDGLVKLLGMEGQ